jgi:hypothetical protein
MGENPTQMARIAIERSPDQHEHWIMEREGAEALSFRLAQQRQWEEAEAVRDGRLPPTDPDGFDLEEIRGGVRYYHWHEVPGTMDGRPALLFQRLVKWLANGSWEDDLDVDCYRYADS